MQTQSKVLVVDDDLINRQVLNAMLTKMGHKAILASGGREALDLLDESVDLVLLDVMMPDMDGFKVVEHVRSNPEYSDLPIIMVTALTSLDDRMRAVECGANDFIAKPIDRTELRVRTLTMLNMKRAQDAVKQHQANLEAMIEQRTFELRAALTDLQAATQKTQEAYLDTVRRLAVAAEHRDEDTAAHIYRVAGYCRVLAAEMGMSPYDVDMIYHASFLHDVGKIGVPDAVLLKRGSLTESEFEIVKQHTLIGAQILMDSTSELLAMGETIAVSHHERWDGTGYPNGLSGENIPLQGRICAIADVFDALMSERPYKPAYSLEDTLEIVKKGRGKHFDPAIADLFLEHLDQILSVRSQYYEQARPILSLWKMDIAA